MSSKDIWYGVLVAGEKTSPVVRDTTLDASEGKVWLYNHLRNQFIEYSKAIVEPKLRALTTGDVPQKKLDEAFKAALKAFSSSHKIRISSDTEPATRAVKKIVKDEEDDIDIDTDIDIEISDDEEEEELDELDD